MNIEWHKKNVLGKKASLEKRITWHVEHQKHCKCRPMPKSIEEALKKIQ